MSETVQPAAEQAPAFSVYPPDEAESAPPPAQPEQASDSGTDDTDDPADDAGAEPESEAKKPRGGFQKRISELTAKAHQAEREAQYWREQATRVQQAPAQPVQQQPAEQPLPPDIAQWVGAEPKPSDFAAGEFDPAYLRAAARYDMRLDQGRMAAQARATQQQQAQQSFAQRVTSLLEATEREAPGASSTLTAHDFPMPEHVLRNVVECEKPEAVLAYLARNPSEAARIAQMRSPVAVARELGRMEARLSAPPPPTPTAAPSPPPTVRGRATAPRSIYEVGEDITPDQYRRLRYG